MSGFLLPLMNALQSFTNQGVVLSGGKIYTYVAGTTTPVATFTDSTLNVQNANPVILDSAGRPPNGIWVPAGQLTKFVVKTSADVQVGPTIDYVPGINDGSQAIAASISALTALPVPAFPTTVTVNGYYTAGDGGGGQFYWDASSSATADGGLVFQANGYSGAGRWIRLLFPKNVIDVRYFGCVESRTTNQNSDAFLAAVAALQASGGQITTLRCVGAFTFDPTRFNYSANQILINNRPEQGEFQFGDTIAFVNSASGTHAANTFYHPKYWRGAPVGGLAAPNFGAGVVVSIVGNYCCRAYSAWLQDMQVFGTLTLEGPPVGEAAGVYGDNVHTSVTNSTTTPGLHIINKFYIGLTNSGFTGYDGNNPATPSVSVLVDSTVQTGFTDFGRLFASYGKFKMNMAGPSGDFNYRINLLHENLNAPYLFDFDTTGQTGFCGMIDFDRVQVADNQGAFSFLRVNDRPIYGLHFSQTAPGILEVATQKLIFNSEADDSGTPTPGSLFMDVSYIQPSFRVRSGAASTYNPSSLGFGAAPGYAKPSFLPFSNTPNGSWTPAANGGFDEVSSAYTIATTVGSSPAIRAFDASSPAASSGDIIFASAWVKRQEQTLVAPLLSLQVKIGGSSKTNAFNGQIFTQDHAPEGSLGGYGWYYIWGAFKLQDAGVCSVQAVLTPQAIIGTLTISDFVLAVVKGDLNRYEIGRLAMSNMRFPFMSGAASGTLSNYYAWPAAPHLFYTDTGFTPALRTLTMFPANVFGTGSGITANRPVAASGNFPKGLQWYDTTLNKPIWTKGDGTWLDATGAAV